MARQQDNRCAICHRLEFSESKRYLSIDHNHQTGKVRALLCGKCNTILGMAGDNIEILRNAVDYLEKYD